MDLTLLGLRQFHVQRGDAVVLAGQGDAAWRRNGRWACRRIPSSEEILKPVDLVLRPWSEHNSRSPSTVDRRMGSAFRRKLFVGERAYQLRCTNAVQGDVGKMQVQFAEQQPKLGELKITGQLCAAR